MKNLKLLFLALFSVISLSVFSQTIVYTTPTSSPNLCDGTAALDTTNMNITSIVWQGMGAIVGQGNYYVLNLCPGTYTVTFLSNGTPVTLTFTIQAGTFNPCQSFSAGFLYNNSVDSISCDGIATVMPNAGTAPYTYSWSNGATTQTISNLCPGPYCCYLTDSNGCTYTACDTVGVQSPNYGDTLIITNPGNCLNPIATLTTTIEDCTLDFDAVDTAYISSVIPPLNPFDSVVVIWIVADTNGLPVCYSGVYTTANGFMNQGCYDFQLIIHCSQKTMTYKTLIVNETQYLGFDGINELSMNKRKLIKVIDLMGQTTELTPNRILIKCYSDGTTEKFFITE